MKLICILWLGVLAGLQAAELRVWFGTGADGIYTSTLQDDTGELSPARRVAELARPSFLALRPDGRSLYAVTRTREGAHKVAGFRVGKDGALAALNDQEAEGKGPCHVDVTPDGRVLLVANYSSGSAASFALADDGTISEAAASHQHEGSSVHPRRQQRPHAHGFFAGPGGKFGYVPDLGIDAVVVYAIEAATGATTKAGQWALPPGTGPRHLKFGQDGKQVYVLGELNLTVVVGDLQEGGLAVQRQVVSVMPEGADTSDMTCSEIRVHPGGGFVYAAARDLRGEGRDALAVFKVLAGGTLERVQVVPAQCAIPRNFALDPGGRWLLVAGQKSNEVPVFRVGRDGRLEFAGKKIEVPAPMCVLFAE